MMMSLLTRFTALAASAACLPSASYADLRNNRQIEDACYPVAAANEALARMPAFPRRGTSRSRCPTNAR